MRYFASLALGVTAALIAAAPAQAVVIDLSSAVDNSGGASFWTATTNFTLPAGFSNAVLNITEFSVDDRGVLQLNGTLIDSTGINGPGTGSFVFTSGGPNDPFVFAHGNGPVDVNITSGFQVGSNQLFFILNDTFQGITGNLTNGPNGPAGPSQYIFSATLTYDEAIQAVPEPATWAMMLLGFGVIGGAMRIRPKARFAKASN